MPDTVLFGSEHLPSLLLPERVVVLPLLPPPAGEVKSVLAVDLNSDSMTILHAGPAETRVVKVVYPPDFVSYVKDVMSTDTASRKRARRAVYLVMKVIAEVARSVGAMVTTETVDNYPFNRYLYYLRKAVKGEGIPFVEVPSHMNSSVCPVHQAFLHGEGRVRTCPAGEAWDKDVVAVYNIASVLGVKADGKKRFPDAVVELTSPHALRENVEAVLASLSLPAPTGQSRGTGHPAG